MVLNPTAEVFVACFRDATVFERSAGGTIVETDVIRKENKKWLVVAAGIDRREAREYFPANAKRAERASEPITIIPNGQLSLLLVLRPVSVPFDQLTDLDNVTSFAPGRGIPLVQLRQESYVRCWDIQDPASKIHSLRWELDVVASRAEPQEQWLRDWRRYTNFNPAHPASHLHLNAHAFIPNVKQKDRVDHSPRELRLGVGVPNPLAMILSLAAWLRGLSAL